MIKSDSLTETMLGLTMNTGNNAYDAAGSMLIGVLLITVAVVVGTEVHSFLLGEAAGDVSDNVQHYLVNQSCVLQVLNVWVIITPITMWLL